MKTDRITRTSKPFSPTPTPPGLISPSFMFSMVIMPPVGV